MDDNSDPEIQFNPGNGDHQELHQSPIHMQGQQDQRQYDRRTKDGHMYCCYGTPRPSIVIKPDSFTGDEDWEQYFSHFEDCAELGRWTDKEMLLTLAASLKGQARVFYTSLPASDKCNYDVLVGSLEQRFGSHRQQARWLSKFQSRSKLYGESIATFGDDLRLLARKAYRNLEPEAQEMLALQQFYKALSVEMRCRVMDRECKTISDAVEVVERYEELLGDSHINSRRRDVVRQAVDYTSDFGRQNTNFGRDRPMRNEDEMQKTLKAIQFRLDRIERSQKRTPQNGVRTCFICQSPDHLYRNCPQKHRREERPQVQSKSENGNPSSL
jgi:hypothetical protein